jgi:hypothetical protein
VQQLEVLVRTAIFKPANALVQWLLQQAADRVDAAYPKFHGCEVIFAFFRLRGNVTRCTASNAFSKSGKWRPAPFHIASPR